MKILIDECIPRKFKNGLAEHECKTVPEAGLSGKKNGELLSLAEEQGFHVFVTMDKGIEFEQISPGGELEFLYFARPPTGSPIFCPSRKLVSSIFLRSNPAKY
jgi:hypothetical protein